MLGGGDILNYINPMIEQMASGKMPFGGEIATQVQARREMTRVVQDYLRGNGKQEAYFGVLAELLRTPEYRRLLLYLPLSDLKVAPKWFRGVYLDAWYELLRVYDVRENFFEGDTFEVDARPDGQLERIVKCAHLTPWLIEAGYLGYADLRCILRLNQDHEILLRSFANTGRMLKERKLLMETERRDLGELTAQVVQRARVEPLYVSEKRQKWLRERDGQSPCGTLLTPTASLTGPFSPNIRTFRDDLEAIQSTLGPREIALVGGSRLKGYGTTTSDLDAFRLEDLKKRSDMKAGSPHAAFIYFDMLWLGGSRVANLTDVARESAIAYFRRSDRGMAIERLESDLLQYRLLHKGFARFYGGHNSAAKDYPEMDGDCPFYDDNYRRIATELFVKYVFIPTFA